MTPITRTVGGKSYTFALTVDALTNPNYGIFPSSPGDAWNPSAPKWIRHWDGRAYKLTPQLFVSEMHGTPAAQSTNVPANVIKKILAAALHIGGGGVVPVEGNSDSRMDDYPATYPIAERMLKDQNSREIEFFAGEIVAAALAAG